VANKDFVVKNSLIVGSTVTINGIELDLAGITTGQVLTYNGSKISATNIADALPSNISSYSQIIGNGSNSTFTITHNLGTKDVVVLVSSTGNEYDDSATPQLIPASNIEVRWEATTDNSISLEFEKAPISNSRKVLIFSSGSEVHYSEIIGDGVSSSIELNHNLGSREAVVVVYNANSPYEVVEVAIQAYSTQRIILDFSKAPQTNSLVVCVFLPLNGYSYGEMIGNNSSKTFTINHKLNTLDIGIISRDTSGLFDFPKVRYELIDENNVKLYYSSAPANNSRYITVYAGLGGIINIPSFDDISVDVPPTPSSPGNIGDMAWDESFIYICIATDTWKRSALTTW
jgi:hypothetical protein